MKPDVFPVAPIHTQAAEHHLQTSMRNEKSGQEGMVKHKWCSMDVGSTGVHGTTSMGAKPFLLCSVTQQQDTQFACKQCIMVFSEQALPVLNTCTHTIIPRKQ